MFSEFSKLPLLAAATTALAVASGCGGGGSSSPTMGGDMPNRLNPVEMAYTRAPAQHRAAATNTPTGGTQSSDSGDVARATVMDDSQGDPEGYVVVLTGSNGMERWSIDTGMEPGTLISNVDDTEPDEQHTVWVAELAKDVDDGEVRVFLSSVKDFAGLDYTSLGRWAFVPDSMRSEEYDFGVFVDSSDPFNSGNLRALNGSADYEGVAHVVAWIDDESVLENYVARTRLTANFGTPSELGNVRGTVDQFTNEAGEEFRDRWILTLAQADIRLGGDFNGDLTGRFVLENQSTVSLAGEWGGTFHGNGANPSVRPSAILGTLGGGLGNTDTVFTGVYVTERQ